LSTPGSVAIADVNGDGKEDLIAGAYSGLNSYVLLNNGNATFQTPAVYDVGSNPVAVGIGDLNNDGFPDLAFADNGSGNVTVLLNEQVMPVAQLHVSAPPNVTAGASFSITVTALSPSHHVAPTYRGTVHFTSGDVHAILPPDYTFTAADAGIHTFTNAVTLETAGAETVHVQDTVVSSIAGGAVVTVAAAAANHLQVSAPASTMAGVAFTLTVTALDMFDNVANTYTGTVHFTGSDPLAVVPSDYSFVGADAGVHTFTNHTTLKTAGNQTVNATDTVTATITGAASVEVTPAAAATFLPIFLRGILTAGQAFGTAVVAFDIFGNVATSYLGTIHFTSSDPQASLPADYTFSASDQGVHVFRKATTFFTAGLQSLTATDTHLSTVTGSNATVVQPGAATHLVLAGPSNVTAGVAFTLTVTALDAYGNVATGYLGTIHFASSDHRALLPGDYQFLSTDMGTHSFTVTLQSVGTQTVTVADKVRTSISGKGTFQVSAPASQMAEASLQPPTFFGWWQELDLFYAQEPLGGGLKPRQGQNKA
jgi:hypothetical protein